MSSGVRLLPRELTLLVRSLHRALLDAVRAVFPVDLPVAENDAFPDRPAEIEPRVRRYVHLLLVGEGGADVQRQRAPDLLLHLREQDALLGLDLPGVGEVRTAVDVRGHR